MTEKGKGVSIEWKKHIDGNFKAAALSNQEMVNGTCQDVCSRADYTETFLDYILASRFRNVLTLYLIR